MLHLCYVLFVGLSNPPWWHRLWHWSFRRGHDNIFVVQLLSRQGERYYVFDHHNLGTRWKITQALCNSYVLLQKCPVAGLELFCPTVVFNILFLCYTQYQAEKCVDIYRRKLDGETSSSIAAATSFDAARDLTSRQIRERIIKQNKSNSPNPIIHI